MDQLMDPAISITIYGWDGNGFPIRVRRVLEDAQSDTLILDFVRDAAIEFNKYKFGAQDG